MANPKSSEKGPKPLVSVQDKSSIDVRGPNRFQISPDYMMDNLSDFHVLLQCIPSNKRLLSIVKQWGGRLLFREIQFSWPAYEQVQQYRWSYHVQFHCSVKPALKGYHPHWIIFTITDQLYILCNMFLLKSIIPFKCSMQELLT